MRRCDRYWSGSKVGRVKIRCVEWIFCKNKLAGAKLTMYSALNSCSAKNRRLSSQDSSKAVRIGSLEESAISEGLARALYALIRDRECRNESSCRELTQSSQPQLRTWHKKQETISIYHLNKTLNRLFLLHKISLIFLLLFFKWLHPFSTQTCHCHVTFSHTRLYPS